MEVRTGDIMWRNGHTGIIVIFDEPKTKHELYGLSYDAVFDSEYYIGKYADLRKAGIDTDEKAWEHFTKFGMLEHRQAKADFNVDIYQARYADLRNAFGNQIALYYRHYCEYGKNEGRSAALPKIGDKVTFHGGKLWVSSSALLRSVPVPKFSGMVRHIENGARHPYYIESRQYDGWCDSGDII